MPSNPLLRRYALWGAAGILAALAAIYALWPAPVPVDFGTVTRGPMRVTVEEEARTRVKEVYVVSAPIAGQLRRIDLHAGDCVTANKTVVAQIVPAAHAFLDVRSRAQAEAGVKAAEAALGLAQAERDSARASLDFADSDLARIRQLVPSGAASKVQLERANLAWRTARAALATTEAAVAVKQSELETARALLLPPGARQDAAEGVLPVASPVTGEVLRVVQESQGVVAAGAPLIEIGDPADLEIVAELLSSDAAKVRAGADVSIDMLEGTAPLEGRVDRVEPYGFTKISALGIEEQRVNVIIAIVSPRAHWRQLGHGYRVEVRITVWRQDNVLRAPLGALFRKEGAWAAFRNVDGRARLTPVKVGALNAETAQILSGLDAGDQLVLYPSDAIGDGTALAARPQ